MSGSRIKLIVCPCFILFLVIISLPVRASLWFVSSTGDDFNSGTSWGNAKRHINTALRLAHPKDQIWVANGRYNETLIMRDAISLYGGFSGTEDSLNARHPSEASTTIAGDTEDTVAGTAPVISVPFDVTARTVLDRFNITQGSIGIYNFGSPQISNCAIFGNSGSGVASGPGAILTLTSCSVSGNTSPLGAGILTYGSAFLKNCIVSDNNPGAKVEYDLFRDDDGIIYTIATTTLTGGGGITIYGGTLTASGCVIQNNQSASHGGGIFVQHASMTLDHCKILQNHADYGGGIDIGPTDPPEDASSPDQFKPGSILIQHCTIARNAGGYGGGISCIGSGSVRRPIDIEDNVIYANSGKQTHGGGIFAEYSYMRIINNTIANHADFDASGVTLYDDPLVILANNILAFNRTGITGRGKLAAQSHNNCVFGNIIAAFDNFEKGSNDFSADPRLSDYLGDDYHLIATSPCINAGDDAFALAGATDYDGNSRVTGAHVDVGAYEHNGGTGLAAVAFSFPSVVGGRDMSGSVKLTSPAPNGGTAVSLSMSNGGDYATVPDTVLVPAGLTTARFSTQTNAISINTTVTVEAVYDGVSKTASLKLLPPPKKINRVKHKSRTVAKHS